MTFTLFNMVISVTRKPRERHDYAAQYAMVAAMKVDDVLCWSNHFDGGKCRIADSPVQRASRNGIKVKTRHKDGELIVRRVA